MIGTLGKAHKVVYVAKNYRSGLTDVAAVVLKPNGDVVGAFPLLEEASIAFRGHYSFEYLTAYPSDPEGEYVVIIISPSESAHRTTLKISFDKPKITTQEIAAEVWNAPVAGLPGSFGELIQKKLLTTARFLGLK